MDVNKLLERIEFERMVSKRTRSGKDGKVTIYYVAIPKPLGKVLYGKKVKVTIEPLE